MTLIWREKNERCLMFNVVVLSDSSLVASGFCDYTNSRAILWRSRSGVDWERALDEPVGTTFSGIAADSDPGSVLIAVNDETGPAVWRGDPSGNMEKHALPTRADTTVTDVGWVDGRWLALGAEYSDRERAVAWLAAEDANDWREIDGPPDAAYLGDVNGDAASGMFLVAGGTDELGLIYWELDAAGAWSTANQGISEFIDSTTAFSNKAVWLRQGATWRERLVNTDRDVSLTSASRLTNGWIVAGWPPGKADYPFMVFVAPDGGAWRELPRLPGKEPAILDMTQFGTAIVGVGDAIYAGPASVHDY